jgi:hypothetical protein
MVSVLTDCPHREKLGWLEQYHLNGAALRYEFDVTRIFIKSMRDMADSQLDTGLIPNIAPEYTRFDGTFRAAAEWGAAFFLVPWQEYEFTGDTSLISDYYEPMKRYLAYLDGRAKEHILDEGLGDWYDLGPADRPGGAQLTPPEITATAYYGRDAWAMSDAARLLGKAESRFEFTRRARGIHEAWRRKFRNPTTGVYGTNSQCSYAIALALGIVDPEDREAALAALVKDIRDRGNAVTAGDVGFGPLLQALSEAGRSELIFDVLMQDEKPGYAYQLKKGETSLTEAWDANPFSSHNHFMLGQVTEWFYKYVAGIRCDARWQGQEIGSTPRFAGFKKIVIAPTPVGDLTWAKARYRSIRGEIATSWRRKDGKFTLEVTVPANTSATLLLPAKRAEGVTESGKPIEGNADVKFVHMENDRAKYQISNGRFKFESEF